MRSIILASVLLSAFATAPAAHAVDLEECTRFPEYQQRTDCLIKNAILTNSAFEIVAGELRKAVQEMRAEITTMKIDILALKSSAPDLSNVVRFGGKIQLRSRQNFSGPGKCIDQRTQPDPTSQPDRVSAADCTNEDIQRWDVAR